MASVIYQLFIYQICETQVYIVACSKKGNIKVGDFVNVFNVKFYKQCILEPSRKVIVNDCYQIVVVDRTHLKNGRVSDAMRIIDFVDDKNLE